MATAEQRATLLAVSCPWCQAAVGEECTVPISTRRGIDRVRVTTLDAGCHDARWRRAVGRSAPVIAGAVAEIVGKSVRRASDPDLDESGSVAVMERPW